MCIVKNKLHKFLMDCLFVVTVIIVQGYQTLGILAISVLNNRPWECLFIILGFMLGRQFVGTTYHAKSVAICTVITWGLFYVLTSSVPSFAVSITIPSLYGIFVAYILSIFGEYQELKKKEGCG